MFVCSYSQVLLYIAITDMYDKCSCKFPRIYTAIESNKPLALQQERLPQILQPMLLFHLLFWHLLIINHHLVSRQIGYVYVMQCACTCLIELCLFDRASEMARMDCTFGMHSSNIPESTHARRAPHYTLPPELLSSMLMVIRFPIQMYDTLTFPIWRPRPWWVDFGTHKA